jgi:hypothetical protein
MTAPRTKSEVLSETAKSYLKEIAKQDFYGYDSQMTNKYVEKGIAVEDESIELYNLVNFTNYVKNTERKSNEFLTGEADIVTNETIIDIKSSWSLETFPATENDINIKDYEMQLRGYMMLYDKAYAQIAYCMVSTPNLSDWENKKIHEVDHIEPQFRVTTINLQRDLTIESQIKERCMHAMEFYTEYIKQIANK